MSFLTLYTIFSYIFILGTFAGADQAGVKNTFTISTIVAFLFSPVIFPFVLGFGFEIIHVNSDDIKN
jgi:hypothetical protein